MSCLECECNQCGHFWGTNRPRQPCPMCGSRRVSRHFDEYPEENDYDEREDD